MLVAANITMQFGAKPLFENVNVKFGEGYRYGLIGANGAGKSTFMKILCGALEPSAGNVSKEKHERMAYLRQDQFAFEDMRVLDVVLMGHEDMWACMQERDAIYANPEATEDDYMKAADLEHHFAEYDGYTAESRAGELLLGVGIPTAQHDGPMSQVAPGWKLRVLLCQALFANPDILLLDEPTNNLDINTIRWLEDVLNARESTMIIISHDRHFLNQVCTHMADLDYGKITIYPGNYDDFMEASTQARERQSNANAKAKERIAELQTFVRRFSANASKAKQATSRMKLIDKLKPEDVKPSSRQYPWIRFDYDEKDKLHRQAVEVDNISFAYDGAERKIFNNLTFTINAGERIAVIGENGVGKTTLLKLLMGEVKPQFGEIRWAEKAKPGYYSQDHSELFKSETSLTDWIAELRPRRRLRGRRRRNADPRHAWPPAVLRRRSQEAGQRHFRRRAGPHAVRQADAPPFKRADHGRADQPPGHGIDRIAEYRAGKIPRHAGLRFARPRVRLLAGDPRFRGQGRRQDRRLSWRLRRLPGQPRRRIIGFWPFSRIDRSKKPKACAFGFLLGV